jgi:hypothetical protein
LAVFETIKILLPHPPGFQNVSVLKKVKMLGDAGLGDIEKYFQLLNRTLAFPKQLKEQKPGGVSQDFEAASCFFQAFKKTLI